MDDVVIRTEGLSKQYYIGGKQETYRTLRDTLADAFVAPFRRASKLLRGHATAAAELNETRRQRVPGRVQDRGRKRHRRGDGRGRD